MDIEALKAQILTGNPADPSQKSLRDKLKLLQVQKVQPKELPQPKTDHFTGIHKYLEDAEAGLMADPNTVTQDPRYDTSGAFALTHDAANMAGVGAVAGSIKVGSKKAGKLLPEIPKAIDKAEDYVTVARKGIENMKKGAIEKYLGKAGNVAEERLTDIDTWKESLKADPKVVWHGSPTGNMRGGSTGLHVGTYKAAEEALNARIGIPADGKGWDGTRAYGETLLAGRKTQEKLAKQGITTGTGFNSGYDFPNHKLPEEDFYPSQVAGWGDNTKFTLKDKPTIQPARIKGQMSNDPGRPHEDYRANGYMSAQLKKGTAKRGFYYSNVGEDAGSISATVPSREHLEILTPNVPQQQVGDIPVNPLDKYLKPKES